MICLPPTVVDHWQMWPQMWKVGIGSFLATAGMSVSHWWTFWTLNVIIHLTDTVYNLMWLVFNKKKIHEFCNELSWIAIWGVYKCSGKWAKIGVIVEICLWNSQGNFQLHRFTASENISQIVFWKRGYFFDSHCTCIITDSHCANYELTVSLSGCHLPGTVDEQLLMSLHLWQPCRHA